LVLAACTHEPELASGHIVVRDAQGALTCQLSATSYGFYRKPSGPRIRVSGGSVDAGEVRIEGQRLLVGGRLRAAIERAPDRVALLDPARAPVGQLVARSGQTWVYDPGGTPLGAARTDGDRVVLTDRDGNAKGYVSGLPQSAAAAFLLGGDLTDLERQVMAIGLR